MAVSPQVIVVSLRGSGTPLLADATTALGYTPYGTMSAARPPGDGGGEQPGPGEVYPLLAAAYGPERAALLLRRQGGEWEQLEAAFQEAVSALWRVWWTRLGQPVALASPVDPGLEARLARVPDGELPGLLPGRGCWYVNSLDLQRADGGFLRAWQATGNPPVVFHHRDVRDRIVDRILTLSRPDGVGTLPEELIYRDILRALPTMDDRITLALTDPGFPGMHEARSCRWLAHHPAVCVITHEELAGPAHGGSAEARERALARLRSATGHPDPGTPAMALPEQATRAREDDDELAVGAWRAYFTPGHERLLSRHHGDLLTQAKARAQARNF
ncbi:hypothetical protein ACIOJD_28410 [Streptomyces sp. NPDC088116]|uniref:hypothetical protein n=1 Tax=Streptomyces sp. NPDC088116 TaxID=3365825 RepID=UPI00380951A2